MSAKLPPPGPIPALWESRERVRRAQQSQLPEALPDRIRVWGFYCALALVFLRFSFFSDFLTYITGKETYVLYIFGPPALIAFLCRGGFRRTFHETGPKIWLAFIIWIAVGVPFSIWKGGSLGVVETYIRTEFILLLFVVGLTAKWAECRKIIYAIAAAAVFNVVVAIFFMQSGEERFSFKWTTSIGNSNDFAAHLLLILPFLLFYILKPKGRPIVRLLLLAPMALGLFEILRTASRGALIALVVTIIFLLLRGSARQRIVIGAAAVLALALMIKILPSDTWNRMLSFSDDAGASKEALQSSDIRKHLLEESIKCTFEHPVFGIGVGQFGYYEAGVRAQPGHVEWRPTHNSYTEISSECGLLALFLYLAALIWAFRLLSRIRKQASGPEKEEMAAAAYAIITGLIAYSVAILFVNFGYAFQFLLVSALIETMWRAVRESCPVPETSGDRRPASARSYPERLAAAKALLVHNKRW